MNSFYGIMLFALAGFVSAAFYTPLKYVKWKWEVMWIFWSLSALILCPMIIASFCIPSCWQAISSVSGDVLIKTFIFGALWGVGGLTFGLSMRYLGIGLGTAVALGFCALVGTLIPPITSGKILEIASTREGLMVLIGVFICGLGIAINGVAGMMKEKDASDSGKGGDSNSEFNLVKGFTVAIIAGFLSACMSLSMEAGKPIAEEAKKLATIDPAQAELFKNSAILIITLIGGFMTNFFWCLFLSIKNKSFADAVKSGVSANLVYFVLCLVGGLLWYCQFFLYGMGQTKLDEKYAFASWAILMAFIIVFAGIIGLFIGEWKGTSKLTKAVLWLGILVLASSTFVISV
jgi:L-rhamnose-H+ transport protein